MQPTINDLVKQYEEDEDVLVYCGECGEFPEGDIFSPDYEDKPVCVECAEEMSK